MYAIIETGGKQYRMVPGEIHSLERLDGNVGQNVVFDKVLLVGGKPETGALVGTPYVANAKLSVEIVQQSQGDKILTIKYRRRKGYRRVIGHRQQLTRVLVTGLEDGTGHTIALEVERRLAALRAASIPYSTRERDRAAARAAKAAQAAPAPARKAQPAAETTAPKKTAAKKTTTKKKA